MGAINRFHAFRFSQGVVQLVARYAAAEDPAGAASRPELGPECQAAAARRAGAYGPLLALLRGLLDPGKAVTEGQKKMTPQERGAAKKQVGV